MEVENVEGKAFLPINTSDQRNTEPDDAAKKKKKKIIIIGAAVAAAVIILIIVLCVTLIKSSPSPGPGPGPGPTPTPKNIPAFHGYNPYNTKASVNSENEYSGVLHGTYYKDSASLFSKAAMSIMSMFQESDQKGYNLTVSFKDLPEGKNNKFIENVRYDFSMINFHTSRLIMTDDDNARWNVPKDIISNGGESDFKLRMEMMGFQLENDPFSYTFSRFDNKSDWYLTTKGQSLVFFDKYIQFDTLLPSANIFGLGERNREFNISSGGWSMWAKGSNINNDTAQYDDGTTGLQTYSIHPFLVAQSSRKGDYIGIFFRNTNAQVPVTYQNKDGTMTLSYITTGGELEVFYFVHNSIQGIVKDYQSIIGKSMLPPLWAYGWMQGGSNYTTYEDFTNLVQDYKTAQLPLEAIQSDYLSAFKYNGNEASTIRKVLAEKPGISVDEKDFLQFGIDNKCLVMTIEDQSMYNKSLVNYQDGKRVVYPDFMHEKAHELWLNKLTADYWAVIYDGVVLDMNEITAECNGECLDGPKNAQTPALPIDLFLKAPVEFFVNNNTDTTFWYMSEADQSQESTWYLPFIFGYKHGRYDYKTLSLNGTVEYNNMTYQQYNTHNLYGHMQSMATHNFFTNKTQTKPIPTTDERPFVVSRSTAPGSGAYTGHWLGVYPRDWSFMKWSISAIMNFNMFGIPFTGADICGTVGQKDDEMCARWYQLAAFYPLARNYFKADSMGDVQPDEPFRLQGENLKLAKNAMYTRFEFIKLMYTCMFQASSDGEMCFTPLLFHFADDDLAYENMENTFMFGNAVKVSPVLEAAPKTGDLKIMSYFPKGNWVDLNDMSVLEVDAPKMVELTPGEYPFAHLAPGSIIPFHSNKDMTFTETSQLLEVATPLIANLDDNMQASGALFVDDGISAMGSDSYKPSYVKFQAQAGMVTIFTEMGNEASVLKKAAFMDSITFANAASFASSAAADLYACGLDWNHNVIDFTVAYDTKTTSLKITPAKDQTFQYLKVIYYGDSTKTVSPCTPAAKIQYTINGNPELKGPQQGMDLIPVNSNLPTLTLTLSLYETGLNANIKFKDASMKTYNPMVTEKQKLKEGGVLYDVINLYTSPFKLEVKDAAKNVVYTLNSEMIFEQNLIFFSETVAVDTWMSVAGVGERTTDKNTFIANETQTLWNIDQAEPMGGQNEYGTHPFYLSRAAKDSYFAVFNQNAGAQDLVFSAVSNKQQNITHYHTRGEIDLYVMMGSTPTEVVKTYHSLIGLPTLNPWWSFGWGQCKWGYYNQTILEEVVANYSALNIPLDVIWSDIDYLQDYKDFTYDTVRFKDLPEIIDKFHNMSLHWVPIIDAGIALRTWANYTAYENGTEMNAFIMTEEGEQLVGQVWPVDAVFVDWTHENATKYWHSQLSDLHSKVKFDGLWLDMDEASNFPCDGACYPWLEPKKPVKYDLRYIPGNQDIEQKQLSLNGLHANQFKEVDMHNMFGYMETQTSSTWFTEVQNKRPFIIDRSSFAGVGQYGSTWNGDNFSSAQYMAASVVDTQLMGLFGIPVTGPDSCGHIGDASPILCARWTVLSAFFPFARNHNDFDFMPQEPYQPRFNIPYVNGYSFRDIMIIGIRARYNLLKYMYTQMAIIHFTGGSYFQPMWMQFPDDATAANEICANQAMLGDALMLSIQATDENMNQTAFYIPAGTWCNVYNIKEKCVVSTGETLTLDTMAYDFYVHLRQGYGIPIQDAATNKLNISNTADLDKHAVDLHFNPGMKDTNGYWNSSADFYADDGLTLTSDPKYNHTWYHFEAYKNNTEDQYGFNITIETIGGDCFVQNKMVEKFGQIYLRNAQATGIVKPDSVDYNVQFNFRDGSASKSTNGLVQYDVRYDSVVFTSDGKYSFCDVERLYISPKIF